MPESVHAQQSTTDRTTDRLSCRVREGVDRVLLEPDGDLDMLAAPRFARLLRECLDVTGGKTVVCDLSGLDFLTTAGLQTLLDADGHARTQGRDLVVLTGGSCTEVLRLLRVTDMDDLLTCRAELDADATVAAAK